MPHLGGLENKVMDVLWGTPSALSVREVHDTLAPTSELAYTTVMTVLDRLAKKHLLTRVRDGRAWLYRPASSREQLLVAEVLLVLRDATADRAQVLSSLVAELDADEKTRLRSLLS
jgi:predicted transcriptional regulator